jgi:hypothetical protein
MKGSRKYPYLALEPGDYGKLDNSWHAMTPSGLRANLANHEVVEHENGTISVTPSILVDNGRSTWHGHLTKGVWQEC